jgi:hypothetical protein
MLCLILVILFFSRRYYWYGYGPYSHYNYPYRGYVYGAYPYGAYTYYDPYWRARQYQGYRPVYSPYGCY